MLYFAFFINNLLNLYIFCAGFQSFPCSYIMHLIILCFCWR